MVLAIVAVAVSLQAQRTEREASSSQPSYNVIYNFTGAADGASPEGGMAMDSTGNLYGTTVYGGIGCPEDTGNLPGCGTVYRLSRRGSAWVLTTLYRFQGGTDGAYPYAGLTVGPDGSLYGTTWIGGMGCSNYGCGTVFKLRPGVNSSGTWTKTQIYRFRGQPDGSEPFAPVTFDQSGNLYGTTFVGGTSGQGTVFRLTPSNGEWTETILHSFASGEDGATPVAGVTVDQTGNLYGTTWEGGGALGHGTVFQLTPSGSLWTEKILYRFHGTSDGGNVYAGVTLGPSGSLYGATGFLGPNNGGTVYKLTPSGGGWTFALLYSFAGQGGPQESLAIDTAGNLYGTTNMDGSNQWGSVFKLTLSNGTWTELDLYDFTGLGDGGQPYSGVAIDANGRVYGTAVDRGAFGYGVVWEVTQ
jgi:uncharacterized repeat protein (TIGR03803 family)